VTAAAFEAEGVGRSVLDRAGLRGQTSARRWPVAAAGGSGRPRAKRISRDTLIDIINGYDRDETFTVSELQDQAGGGADQTVRDGHRRLRLQRRRRGPQVPTPTTRGGRPDALPQAVTPVGADGADRQVIRSPPASGSADLHTHRAAGRGRRAHDGHRPAGGPARSVSYRDQRGGAGSRSRWLSHGSPSPWRRSGPSRSCWSTTSRCWSCCGLRRSSCWSEGDRVASSASPTSWLLFLAFLPLGLLVGPRVLRRRPCVPRFARGGQRSRMAAPSHPAPSSSSSRSRSSPVGGRRSRCWAESPRSRRRCSPLPPGCPTWTGAATCWPMPSARCSPCRPRWRPASRSDAPTRTAGPWITGVGAGLFFVLIVLLHSLDPPRGRAPRQGRARPEPTCGRSQPAPAGSLPLRSLG
jgi:hypothetical protein